MSKHNAETAKWPLPALDDDQGKTSTPQAAARGKTMSGYFRIKENDKITIINLEQVAMVTFNAEGHPTVSVTILGREQEVTISGDSAKEFLALIDKDIINKEQ